MALATNLTRRSGSKNYYVRREVPKELQPIIGKREVWVSTGTSDPREAKRKARAIHDRLEAEWDAARPRTTLTDDDIEHAVWTRYLAILETDERFRTELPTDEDLDDVWAELTKDYDDDDLEAFRILRSLRDAATEDRDRRLARLRTLNTALTTNETRPVRDVVDAVLAEQRVEIHRSDPAHKKLSHHLMRAEREALARTFERDKNVFHGKPKDPVVKPPSRPHIAASPDETVMAMFERYARENPNNVKPDTLAQARAAVQMFADFVGPKFAATAIDKKAVRDWKALLLDYPVKASETKAFRGLGLREIIEANKTEGKPAITPRTVNRYLSGLSAFCDWLRVNDYIPANPCDDLLLKVDKRSKRRPFTTDELNKLFRAPLFTGCMSEDRLHVPGNLVIDEHEYWLPLVMLFSGARPAEIAQLLVTDVRQEHDHWIMHITTTADEDDDRSVKTAGSMRVVPVHSELVRLGFIGFRNRQADKGEKRLFPRAERNKRGQIAADFSRAFTRQVLKGIDLEDPGRLSLYSFRHGFIDAIRRAGLLDEAFGFIVGHTKATTTGIYGTLPQGMLTQRIEIVEKVAYPGLDLAHLYR
ncbi:site-specific integrase [Mongoliimonas terrestris]|uniref:site-specific integrase n=1 Tax=Mongoliimonas terrestris TaxID=1709001 RepID=UPI000949662F|nr:site-specific integrase [Mongoliimonas terrestris]